MPTPLYNRLKKHRDDAVKQFHDHHPHAAKFLSISGLSATLLLSAPTSPRALPQKTAQVILAEAGIQPISSTMTALGDALKPLIPHRIGHLDPDTEVIVSSKIHDLLNITASSSLEGQRLNHSLGWIGYEQHLLRHAGDSINQHDTELAAGIAPHTGAWGYIDNPQYEKYYVAVQTLYLPTWGKDTRFLSDWYRYRKVIVINVENGQVVVAVIGDAGPASWTGKQFGGSPEVMRSLDLTGKKSKGKVLLLFVDDPQNKIPLGPITQPLSQDIKLT